MAHGGRRAGAGRKPGSGWRPAVLESRTRVAEQLSELVGSERDPLLLVLDAAFNPELDMQTRLGAAALALPFVHPKLSASTVSASHVTTRVDASDLLQRLDERMARVAVRTIEADPVDPGREAA